MPTKKKPVAKKPAAKKPAAKKPVARKPAPETIDAALDRLQAALEAADHPDYARLVFTPIGRDTVAQAEARLGAKLPPSYVDLVTRRGAFEIRGTNKAKYNPLLAPLDLARHTLETRKAYHEADPDTGEALDDLLLFQGNLYLDNFYAFVISSKRPDGEMGIVSFYHDDHYEPSQGSGDFRSHVVDLVDEWISKLEE